MRIGSDPFDLRRWEGDKTAGKYGGGVLELRVDIVIFAIWLTGFFGLTTR